MIHYSNKIAVALSGGVDSAVAAKMLKDEGYQLVGFFLKLWSDPKCQLKGENRCCDYEALEDARRVAANLKIPFYVIDAKEEFKKQVVDYFIDEYKNLRTPNPCVVCNQKIKFDLLLRKALQIGCDYLATGHYARIENSENPKSEIPVSPAGGRNSNQIPNSNDIKAKSYKLKAGFDPSKDQSYNLYRLTQEQLAHIIFPLGEMTKKGVRELAKKWDLPVKEKPESQEICFFGDNDYREFLKRYLPDNYFKPGEIADSRGNIIGEHEGLVNYTVGQRKNINQNAKIKDQSSIGSDCPEQQSNGQNDNSKRQNKAPLYTIGFNIENNRLIVGEDSEVYSREMEVGNLHWINEEAISNQLTASSLTCKIRSQANKFQCEIAKDVSPTSNHKTKVIFNQPQRAVTPGQSAVFYAGDEVVGGGVIIS